MVRVTYYSQAAYLIRSRRQQKGKQILFRKNEFTLCSFFISVLCDLFDQADNSRNGKVSLDEFMAMCVEHGVQLSEDGKEELKPIFDQHGEV